MGETKSKAGDSRFGQSASGLRWRGSLAFLSGLAFAAGLAVIAIVGPIASSRAVGLRAPGIDVDQNKRRVPDYDINLASFVTHPPSTVQLQALEALKSNLGDQNIAARWDKSSGSIDTIYDFASAPSTLDPESAARAFIAANGSLFGISDMSTLNLKSNVEALGGNLLYFEQV